MGVLIDLTGKRFERLVVSRREGVSPDGQITWECKCDCGGVKVILGNSLRRGLTKSCGCYQLETLVKRNADVHALPLGVSSRRGLIARYKREAQKRNRVWGLAESDFDVLIQGDCYYCDAPPEQVYISNRKSRGSFIYNGIDRRDNNQGYTPDNCVSCCGKCNWWKRSLSEAEFYTHARRILAHRGQQIVTATGGQ
jgi:hypothetical protein